VNVYCGLREEGLEEVIPDIFEVKVSEVDQVREKVGIGIEAPGIARFLQVVFKETPERLVEKLVANAERINREIGIEADVGDKPK